MNALSSVYAEICNKKTNASVDSRHQSKLTSLIRNNIKSIFWIDCTILLNVLQIFIKYLLLQLMDRLFLLLIICSTLSLTRKK